MSEPITAKDITPAQFAAWRQHPVTAVMFQFMRDYATLIEKKMIHDWRVGHVKLSDETEARGRVLAFSEITTLEWKSVQAFYDIEPEPEEEQKPDVSR